MKGVLNINYFVDSNICEKMISFFYKYLDTKELNVNDMYDGRTINLFNCSAESHELNCFNEIINSIKKVIKAVKFLLICKTNGRLLNS